jgi:hypothetical protein
MGEGARGEGAREGGDEKLSWLQAETTAIVATARFGRLVAALVPVLLEHRTLSGRAVREILNEANERR